MVGCPTKYLLSFKKTLIPIMFESAVLNFLDLPYNNTHDDGACKIFGKKYISHYY